MAKYLVTGGAGFIGSHLVELLVQEGHTVTIIDNLSTGKKSNIEHIKSESVKLIVDDVCNDKSLENAAVGSQCIIHLAAMVSVPLSIKNPIESFRINALGSLSVLDVARRNKIKNVVLASSAAVYGNCSSSTISEDEITSPLSPYGMDKLTAENYGRLYASIYDLNVTALRFFNVFGPRQDPSSPYSGVISIFINHIMNRTPPVIFGDGEQSRDFIAVRDVARCLIAASNKQGFNVINVGTGRSIKINQIWDKLQNLSHTNIEKIYKPERQGDIRYSTADVKKLLNDLDITAEILFETGLETTLKTELARMQQ